MIRVPRICFYRHLEYKFLYILRINQLFIFLKKKAEFVFQYDCFLPTSDIEITEQREVDGGPKLSSF